MTKQSHPRPTPTLPIYRTDAHHRSQIRFLVLFLQKKDVSLNQSKYNLSRLSGLHNSLVLRLLRRFASRNDGECAINSPRRVIPAKAGIHPRIMLVQNWILAFAGMTYSGVRKTSREDIRNTKVIINKANQHRLLRRFDPRNDGLSFCTSLREMRLSRMTKQSHRRPTSTLPIYRTDAHHRSQIRFLVLFLQKKDVSLNQSKYNLSRLSGLHNSLVLRLLRRFASRNDGECAINSPRRVIPAKAGIHPRIMMVQNWILAFARMTFDGENS